MLGRRRLRFERRASTAGVRTRGDFGIIPSPYDIDAERKMRSKTAAKIYEDLIQLIGKNCSISDETALSILQIASLSPDTMGYYANGNARSAPFIQISEHQYLRTIKGLLDEPFDFILYNIRNFFPEAWDKNVNQREAVFRTQLYTVFD